MRGRLGGAINNKTPAIEMKLESFVDSHYNGEANHFDDNDGCMMLNH